MSATRARWDPCAQRARAPVPAASGVRSSPAALLLVQLFAARATSAPMLLGMARFGGRVALAQGVRSACTGRVRAAARLRAYEVNCWMLIYCMRLIQKYIVYVACMRVYEAHATCMSQYEGWFDTGFIYEAHRRPVCSAVTLSRSQMVDIDAKRLLCFKLSATRTTSLIRQERVRTKMERGPVQL